MDWNSSTKLFFAILFTFKGTDASSPPDTSSRYDVTKILNDSFAGIFGGIDLNAKIKSAKLSRQYGNMYSSTKTLNESAQKIRSIADEISMVYYIFHYGEGLFINGPYITHWSLSKNEMQINFGKFHFHIKGTVKITKANLFLQCDYENFVILSGDNFTITAKKLQENHHDDEKIQIDVLFNNRKLLNNAFEKCRQIPYKQQLKLTHTMSMAFPAIIRDCIITKSDFVPLMNNTLNHIIPRLKISSIHTDFVENEQHYYYHIPIISFVHFHLKNIKIVGIWNLEPYKHHYDRYRDANTPFTLLVKNVKGSMMLDSESEHFPQFKLKFVIGELSMLSDQITNIRVLAKNYSILEDTSTPSTRITPWLTKFSDFIMGNILSEIETMTIPFIEGTVNRRNLPSTRTMLKMETMLTQLLEKSTNNTDKAQAQTSNKIRT